MAHENRAKYSELVLKRMDKSLVTKENLIFNTNYEGNPAAGSVKIPVMGSATVADYNPSTGMAPTQGDTTYIEVLVDQDKAVNEIIDGWDAASVPGGLVATRLTRAGRALATTVDADALATLATEGTISDDTTALTKTNAFDKIVDALTKLSENDITADNRYVIVKPAVHALLLKSDNFVKQSDLGQELVANGVVGKVAGANVFVSNNMPATVEFIAGHSDCATRVRGWKHPVKVVDLDGDAQYVGACAVKGRIRYKHKVTIPEGIVVKTTA